MEQQRTAEWFEKRRGLVTGSNVGAILGVDPFRTPGDVMRAMVRAHHRVESEFKGNVATQWGTFQEQNAIANLSMEHNIDVIETGFHIHPEHTWLGASPDGFTDNQSVLGLTNDMVVEIKCPFYIRNDKTPAFKTLEEQPHYYAQMQIEMYCTQKNECVFYQWTPSGDSLELVSYSQDWIDKNLYKLQEFYTDYVNSLDNPEHLTDKTVNIIATSATAERYKKELFNLELQKGLVERLKEQLIKQADGAKSKIGGINVYPVKKEGSVSYAKVVKEHCKGVDLEPYRGKPSSYWVVKC